MMANRFIGSLDSLATDVERTSYLSSSGNSPIVLEAGYRNSIDSWFGP